jgi:hypothetical protein
MSLSHLPTAVRFLGTPLLLLGVLVGCSATPAAEGSAEPTDAAASASASVEPTRAASPSATPSPSPTPEPVLLAYEGQWTLTVYANDLGEDDPEYQVGDTRPGSVEIRCDGPMAAGGYCGATLSWDGQPFSETSVEIIGDGELLMVLEDELANCEDGQLRRTSIEIDYDEASAEATYERVTEPRTCDDGSGTLYMTDDTWSFEGTLGD